MRNGIQPKVALLRLAERLGNVSQACRVTGRSRDSFYRYKKLYARGGAAALAEQSRVRPVPKNRVAPEVEDAVVRIAFEEPMWGQARVADELRQRGSRVSPAGVRSVWMRHGLETRAQRLEALEVERAQGRIDPSPAPLHEPRGAPPHASRTSRSSTSRVTP